MMHALAYTSFHISVFGSMVQYSSKIDLCTLEHGIWYHFHIWGNSGPRVTTYSMMRKLKKKRVYSRMKKNNTYLIGKKFRR